MTDHDRDRDYWVPAECEGSVHCPPRCPRFVDREGASWVVRPVRQADTEALVEVYDDFAPGERAQGVPPRKRSRIESWVDDLVTDGCNFVVVDGDSIVGHALYTPTDDDEPEFAVFVHQDYQNRGIGTEVSKHVLVTAAVADRTALTLLVEPSNHAAVRLYEKLGFEEVERYGGDGLNRGSTTLRMRRPLSTASVLEYRHPPRLDGESSTDPAVESPRRPVE